MTHAIAPPKIEVVAELAQGFEGKPEQSALMLRAAATAGADAVKYQLVYADELATPDYKYFDLFRTLEMPDAVWADLAASAAKAGIKLHFDVFGERSLKLAEEMGADAVKLHGTDLNNLGFLEAVAKSGVRRVMLGAGGGYRQEIETAVRMLGGKEVVVLVGFQSYPTPTEANQIARVRQLADDWAGNERVVIGFADHAPPEDLTRLALAATALGAGARVFEKHLTLGRSMKLEDHESALNPDEFAEFCRVLRHCAAAYGAAGTADDFDMSDAERGYRKAIRRHVVAARDLDAGIRLSPADLVLKRSGAENFLTGFETVYGRTLRRSVAADTAIGPDDIEAP